MNPTFLAAVKSHGGLGAVIRTASGTIPAYVNPPDRKGERLAPGAADGFRQMLIWASAAAPASADATDRHDPTENHPCLEIRAGYEHESKVFASLSFGIHKGGDCGFRHSAWRIRLCTGVLIPSNRIAPVAASALASLNALAPGRIHFGVGTGFTARRTMGLLAITPPGLMVSALDVLAAQ
jgi:hypothetical protein